MTVSELIHELNQCQQDTEIGFAFYDPQIKCESYRVVGGLSEGKVNCERFGELGYVDVVSDDSENESVIILRNG